MGYTGAVFKDFFWNYIRPCDYTFYYADVDINSCKFISSQIQEKRFIT